MRSHYDVLGVEMSAPYDEIRAAYHRRAQELHPDRVALRPRAEQDAARVAMQDVNEAWRVLRDARSRSSYDTDVRQRAAAAMAETAPHVHGWDEPYHGTPAEPGDLTVALVRAAPWVVVLVVLTAIIVFTAYARRADSPRSLIGQCISTTDGVPHQAPCNEPNDGQVVDVVDAESSCAPRTTPRVMASGDWFCLRD